MLKKKKVMKKSLYKKNLCKLKSYIIKKVHNITIKGGLNTFYIQ